MLRPTNAGNTMTFLTITTFNQLQSKPLVCMAIHCPFLELSRKELDISGNPRERQWLHQRLSLAVVRGNIASILACVQVWSDFSHPQCINQCSCPSLASLQCIAITFQLYLGQLSRQSAPIRMSAKRKRITCAWPHRTDRTNFSDHIQNKIINISTEMGCLHVKKYNFLD